MNQSGQSDNVKTKKPIWKRWWFITISVFFVLFIIAGVSESLKSPETRAREKVERERGDSIERVKNAVQDSIKLENAIAGYDSEAYIVAKDIIELRLKFPKTADFPWTPTISEYEGNRIYLVIGKVTAQNAFGVPKEHVWKVRLFYKGGEPLDGASWQTLEATMD